MLQYKHLETIVKLQLEMCWLKYFTDTDFLKTACNQFKAVTGGGFIGYNLPPLLLHITI